MSLLQMTGMSLWNMEQLTDCVLFCKEADSSGRQQNIYSGMRIGVLEERRITLNY